MSLSKKLQPGKRKNMEEENNVTLQGIRGYGEKILQKKKKTPPAIYVLLWKSWLSSHSDNVNYHVDDAGDRGENNINGDDETLEEILEEEVVAAAVPAGGVVDWNQLMKKVRKKPSLAFYSDEERLGMLLLHFVCALHPPLPVIEVLLEANKNALWSKSLNGGITPLMVACGRNASLSVIRYLLFFGYQQHSYIDTQLMNYNSGTCGMMDQKNGSREQHLQKNQQKLLKVQDDCGFTALHWASREDVSKQIVRQILMISPSCCGSDTSSSGGRYSPLDILCPKMMVNLSSSSSPSSLASTLFSNNTNRNQWDKICYILWARHYGTVNTRRSNCRSQDFSTLHAALALRSCGAQNTSGLFGQETDYYDDVIIPIALQLYASQVAGVRDIYGNLPLHYAVQIKSCCRNSNKYIITKLLQHFPQSAKCVSNTSATARIGANSSHLHYRQQNDNKHRGDNAYGNYPLHMALKNDRNTWLKGGIKELYEHFPAAINIIDPETCLYPCFLSAVFTNDIETTFCLLLQNPDVLSLQQQEFENDG